MSEDYSNVHPLAQMKCAQEIFGKPPNEPKPVETFCIDCGQPTIPGKGSARCAGCWSDRCGN